MLKLSLTFLHKLQGTDVTAPAQPTDVCCRRTESRRLPWWEWTARWPLLACPLTFFPVFNWKDGTPKISLWNCTIIMLTNIDLFQNTRNVWLLKIFCLLIILEGQLAAFAGEPAIRSVHFPCPGVPPSPCSAVFENVVLISNPVAHRGKAGLREFLLPASKRWNR